MQVLSSGHTPDSNETRIWFLSSGSWRQDQPGFHYRPAPNLGNSFKMAAFWVMLREEKRVFSSRIKSCPRSMAVDVLNFGRFFFFPIAATALTVAASQRFLRFSGFLYLGVFHYFKDNTGRGFWKPCSTAVLNLISEVWFFVLFF